MTGALEVDDARLGVLMEIAEIIPRMGCLGGWTGERDCFRFKRYRSGTSVLCSEADSEDCYSRGR
jgi:hypothetical protein